MDKNCIFLDSENFCVVNKPAGILSQPDHSSKEDIAFFARNFLKNFGKNESFLAPVHRLDRNTSGLILLAKNSEAARELSELIKQGKMEKTYLALVKGDPGPKGVYNFPLKKNEEKNQVFLDEDGMESLTEFFRREKFASSSLVEIYLRTGRPHQIRAHFSLAGHPLIGDKKYGKKPWSEIFSRPALHAHRLRIPKEAGIYSLDVKCPLPQEMATLIQKLAGKSL